MTNVDFNKFWDENNKRIVNFFIKRGVDDELASDMSQDVFHQLLLQIEQSKKIENPEAWVQRVAKNKLIDFYRKKSVIPWADDAIVSAGTDEESNRFKKWFLGEMKCCFEIFLNEFDQETQFIMREVELKNKKQKDLAQELNMSYPTLRSKVQRTRDKIRARFFETCSMTFDPRGNVISCVSKSC